MQDGLDFITALAAQPDTARYLATKLYRFFVSRVRRRRARRSSNRDRDRVPAERYEMKAVMREVLLSPEFWDPRRTSPATPGRSSSSCAR